jgi:hypothetical protein
MQIVNMNSMHCKSGATTPSCLAAPRKFGMASTARQLTCSPLTPFKAAMPARRSGKT